MVHPLRAAHVAKRTRLVRPTLDVDLGSNHAPPLIGVPRKRPAIRALREDRNVREDHAGLSGRRNRGVEYVHRQFEQVEAIER